MEPELNLDRLMQVLIRRWTLYMYEIIIVPRVVRAVGTAHVRWQGPYLRNLYNWCSAVEVLSVIIDELLYGFNFVTLQLAMKMSYL